MTSLRKQTLEQKDIALIDILDVILDKGIAIKGDLLISIAIDFFCRNADRLS